MGIQYTLHINFLTQKDPNFASNGALFEHTQPHLWDVQVYNF